ncbi:hypothetical protein P3X46_034933, partial [Hevea brasiliensis]
MPRSRVKPVDLDRDHRIVQWCSSTTLHLNKRTSLSTPAFNSITIAPLPYLGD